MSYDMIPRNASAEDFSIGAFSWPMMLEAGLGLVVGYTKGFRPTEYIQLGRPDGLCVSSNDGARVTSKEAKQMAQIANWIADAHDAQRAEWDKLTSEERQHMMESQNNPVTRDLYKIPPHADHTAKFRNFAEWAVKSGGFKIT